RRSQDQARLLEHPQGGNPPPGDRPGAARPRWPREAGRDLSCHARHPQPQRRRLRQLPARGPLDTPARPRPGQDRRLLRPWPRHVAIKDFAWKSVPGKPKAVWQDVYVPLREGIVPWPEFFERLARTPFDGPISLHSEYQGKGSWRNLNTTELIEQTAADLAFV